MKKKNWQRKKNKEYTIQKIIARRLNNNKIEYFIKWKNFSFKYNTRKTMDDLEQHNFDKLFHYENMSIEKKISFLKKYRHLKEIKI